MTELRINPKMDLPGIGRDGSGTDSRGSAALADQIRALKRSAHLSPTNAWSGGKDLGAARNAHSTNLVPELRAALAGPYDWFEGDIRMRGNEPVMAHDADQVQRAITLQDWIDVGGPSGRGLKLDCKDASVIGPAISKLKQARVPDERVLFNVGAGLDSPAGARVTLAQLREIRQAFPKSTINLDPGPGPYSPAEIAHVVQLAKQVGGDVMFPLDAKWITPDFRDGLLGKLLAAGKVAVWNNPSTFVPRDVDAQTDVFRKAGITGTIDLRGLNNAARIR